MRKEKIQMKDEMEKLQRSLDELMKERTFLQGNLGEEIEKLRKKITEQEFSYEERIRLLKLDH